jgi:hypothetical protein
LKTRRKKRDGNIEYSALVDIPRSSRYKFAQECFVTNFNQFPHVVAYETLWLSPYAGLTCNLWKILCLTFCDALFLLKTVCSWKLTDIQYYKMVESTEWNVFMIEKYFRNGSRINGERFAAWLNVTYYAGQAFVLLSKHSSSDFYLPSMG